MTGLERLLHTVRGQGADVVTTTWCCPYCKRDTLRGVGYPEVHGQVAVMACECRRCWRPVKVAWRVGSWRDRMQLQGRLRSAAVPGPNGAA